MKNVILFPLLLLFTSCSHAQPETGITEVKDLLYLENPDVDSLQRLNLTLPSEDKHVPLFIWIGGGAWSYVDRHAGMGFAKKLAKHGIGVANVGHRLSPALWRDSSMNVGIQHPKHVEDIAASIKWLYEHADQYRFDKDYIYVGGFSSGAHLAALVALDGRYLGELGLSKGIVKGIVPVSGAYDIVNYHEVFVNSQRPEMADLHVKAVFGETEQAMVHASPTTYLDNVNVPMLLIADNSISNYTRIFEERLKASGFEGFQVYYAEDLSHGQLWREMSTKENSFYRKKIVEFIRQERKG